MRKLSFLRNVMFTSLQNRIIMIVFVFMFIPFAVSTNYNFSHAEIILRDKTSKLILDNLQQSANQIEGLCLDMIKLTNIICTDDVILEKLSDTHTRSGSGGIENTGGCDLANLTEKDTLKLISIEKRLNYSKSNIFSNYDAHVLIFGNDGIIYSVMDNFTEEYQLKLKLMKEFKNQQWNIGSLYNKNKEAICWTVPFSYNISEVNNKEKFISVTRAIKSDYYVEPLGVVMINLSQENLLNILDDNTSGVVCLLNQDKKVVFSSKNNNQVSPFTNVNLMSSIPSEGSGYTFIDIDKEKYMLNYYSMKRFGWKLISVIPYSEVMKEINALKAKTYALNSISLILFLFITLGFIIYITNPLKKLIKNIRKMKIGDYPIGMQKDIRTDEVSGIVKSFDYMFRRIEELVNTVIEEQKLEHALKYEALRAQINPHFLFNTLNTIKWSAMMSGANNVSRMISSLGKLLEASMNKGDEEILFKEEFELVEEYIYIQNLRYDDKFKLIFDIDDEILNYMAMKLILQPIVENAIMHGLKNKKSECLITIQAKKMEDYIILNISDNGEGISRDKINQLNEENNGGNKHKLSGIGLKNIQDRIKLRYGEQYGLEILSCEGKGTTISIKLPVIYKS